MEEAMPPDPDPKPDPQPDPPKPDPKPDDSKAFTQADVDRIVSDRLKRESTKFADYDDLKAKADRLKELEDKDKSESQKLTDDLAKANADGSMTKAELLRMEVALDKAPDAMPAKEVAKYAKRLHGATREELEADAEEFFKDFTPPGTQRPPSRKPRSDLRSGSGDDGDVEPNISEIVKKIPRQ